MQSYQTVTRALDTTSLSIYQIKLFALVFMTLDHIGKNLFFLLPPLVASALQLVGRLAAPLFLFALIVGLQHTRSKVRYALRMYLASWGLYLLHALIVLLELDHPDVLGFHFPDDIFLTWFWVILLACAAESIRKFCSGKQLRALLPLLCVALFAALSIVLAQCFPDSTLRFLLFPVPGPELTYWYFVPLGVVMYLVRSKRNICLIFGGFSLIFLLVTVLRLLSDQDFWGVLFFSDNQWAMLFSLPFMALCSERRGRPAKAFFYGYYLLHGTALYVLGLLLYPLIP